MRLLSLTLPTGRDYHESLKPRQPVSAHIRYNRQVVLASTAYQYPPHPDLLSPRKSVSGNSPVWASTKASVARLTAHHAFSDASRISPSAIRARAAEYIARASVKICVASAVVVMESLC